MVPAAATSITTAAVTMVSVAVNFKFGGERVKVKFTAKPSCLSSHFHMYGRTLTQLGISVYLHETVCCVQDPGLLFERKCDTIEGNGQNECHTILASRTHFHLYGRILTKLGINVNLHETVCCMMS
jgi:hypothetical protein